jgi:hypothetical protein
MLTDPRDEVEAARTFAANILGHATIVKMATLFTWIYGILIIPFMILSIPQISAHRA